MGVNLPPHTAEAVCSQLLHLGQQVPFKTHALVGVVLVQVALELFIAHLVSWLEFTVVFGLLLNGVVGEVDVPVAQVLEGVFTHTRP